ncbi:MAG TPA: sugar ABC transporter substrate-binding protein [Bauldia sp.]|nr:sugar ABC transporter substrate-binding protein [Bauldia sp.]
MRLSLSLGGIALAVALASPALAADKIKVGFITKFPVPYFATMEDAAKEWGKAHPDVEIIYGQGKNNDDIDGTIALIENMVAQGVKGIAITPIDPSISKSLDKAIAAGVKVVLMDNDIPGWEGRSALATTNNREAGKIAGGYLKTVLKDGDKIGILDGKPEVVPLNDRVEGMLEGLSGVKVDIVGRGRTACEPDKGQQVAEDILTAHPELKAIYSACGPPAASAATAIKNAKLDHKVILVGFDFCCGEEDAIAKGEEDASVAQFPKKMSEFGLDGLIKAIKGEPVEKLIDTGAALVTKANMDQFK